jgi:23S rRNA (cytosine1962-C5)-methyltransferase
LVVNNDMSRPALQWGRDNHELNGHDPQRVRMLPHNLFKSWWKIRQLGPYDRIIIDPPTSQRGSFVAEQHYGRVLKRIPELAAPGAQILACLNSPFLDLSFLPAQMARWSPLCRPLACLLPSPDFPDRSRDRGLKLALFRYEP